MTLEIPQCSLVPSTFKSSLQYTLLQWSGITRGIYRIDGKFGGELNLAVWQSSFATTKLKSTNISYLHIYVWRSLTKLPNLNLPIFFVMAIWGPTTKFNSRQYFRLYGNFFNTIQREIFAGFNFHRCAHSRLLCAVQSS